MALLKSLQHRQNSQHFAEIEEQSIELVLESRLELSGLVPEILLLVHVLSGRKNAEVTGCVSETCELFK